MMATKVQIHFLGAAGTVTGSKYLLEIGRRNILVDCGLFQGVRELRMKNWEYLPTEASSIDVVLLTHGHLDHTGYLPRLIQQGFKGKIYGTGPTLDITEIILNDSARIQEQEAERANREGYSKHHPAKPLYGVADVEDTLPFFKVVSPAKWLDLFDGIKAKFSYNGHILGGTFIELDIYGKRCVFSGDIGRTKDLLLFPPFKPKKADILFIESTYGGKFHPAETEVVPFIEDLVNDTISQGGSLFIPSFSVERAQLLMLILSKLIREKRIPRVPMIMDSPMGADVLELFHRSMDWHRLNQQQCYELCSAFTVVSSFRETLEISYSKDPKIVIAGSGMLTGGRMLNYLEVHASNPKNTLLFVGFQAEGTRGRRILDGEKKFKAYGKWVPVHMRIEIIEGLSAHADHTELLQWISELSSKPERIFIVHGENESSEALKKGISDTYGWDAEIPELYGIAEVSIEGRIKRL